MVVHPLSLKVVTMRPLIFPLAGLSFVTEAGLLCLLQYRVLMVLFVVLCRLVLCVVFNITPNSVLALHVSALCPNLLYFVQCCSSIPSALICPY